MTKVKNIMLSMVIVGALCCLLSSISFGYSGGSGTTEEPYQIATKQDLLDLAADTNNYDKCFILTADIDMEGQVFTNAIIAVSVVHSFPFEGTAFTGTFDGNGHKITNFTVNGVEDYWYVGLFGYIGPGGAVKNLGLEDFAVSGSWGLGHVGGLAGENDGSISHCYSTGLVNCDIYSSGEFVGCLVGCNLGSISHCYSTGMVGGRGDVTGGLVGLNDGTISNCYSTCEIGSGFWMVGGLVGCNDNSISNCYSTGAVSGSGSEDVGGLVGCNFCGSISNCYSTGVVSGSMKVGGLVGENGFSFFYPGGSTVSGGSISDCYSTGSVIGDANVGGLVGYNAVAYGSSVVGSFWDTQTSGWMTSDGGEGKTTAEMKTKSTFTDAGWDFLTIWDIVEHQTYPYLKSFCITVTIDIMPSNVPVAILSSATFDATTVDRSTVEFAGAHPLPNYCSQLGEIPEDVDGDGLLDIVFNFKIQDLNLPPGDTEACLTGRTFSGQEFRGCDNVLRLGPVAGDLDGNGKVDFKDSAIFASHWLECTDPNCE